MAKVERLAWHAMNMTESDEIKAEACYILARYFHYNRDYEKAFKVASFRTYLCFSGLNMIFSTTIKRLR